MVKYKTSGKWGSQKTKPCNSNAASTLILSILMRNMKHAFSFLFFFLNQNLSSYSVSFKADPGPRSTIKKKKEKKKSHSHPKQMTHVRSKLMDFLPATWHWGAAWQWLDEPRPSCCWHRCWAGCGQCRRTAWPALAPPPCRQNRGSRQALCGHSACCTVACRAHWAHTANVAGAPGRTWAPPRSSASGVKSCSLSEGSDPLLLSRGTAGLRKRVEQGEVENAQVLCWAGSEEAEKYSRSWISDWEEREDLLHHAPRVWIWRFRTSIGQRWTRRTASWRLRREKRMAWLGNG